MPPSVMRTRHPARICSPDRRKSTLSKRAERENLYYKTILELERIIRRAATGLPRGRKYAFQERELVSKGGTMASGTRVRAPTETQLKYVKLNGGKLDLRYFPHFFIAGPQRTGTTWLWRNLGYHPQIFVADPRAICYFNCLKNPAHIKYRSSNLGWYQKHFQDTPLSYSYKMLSCLSRYREPYRPKMRGEATASYAALEKDVISDIVLLRPEIKVILMIRNPLERAWSHAKKDLAVRKHRPVSAVPSQEFERFFADPYQRACADYERMIQNWTDMLLDGNLFIGRFDEIRTDPAGLLRRVYTFLGVDASPRYITQHAHEKVNATMSDKLPERYRSLLEEMFAKELDFLRKNFNLSWD